MLAARLKVCKKVAKFKKVAAQKTREGNGGEWERKSVGEKGK